jgi:hypothetical protein
VGWCGTCKVRAHDLETWQPLPLGVICASALAASAKRRKPSQLGSTADIVRSVSASGGTPSDSSA